MPSVGQRQFDGTSAVQAAPGRRPLRAGFTLVEMLVSLAVLAVALTVVSVVFTVTTKTVSQAAALAEVHGWVRNFLIELDEDLALCEPGTSVLVLVGRTQRAALTQDDVDAGKFYRVLVGNPQDVPSSYQPEFSPNVDNGGADGIPDYSDPRADILMFFSQRPTISQAPPSSPSAGTAHEDAMLGAKLAPIQVVYGHAAFGEAGNPNGTYAWGDGLRHIENVGGRSLIPASRWHLARRATIIEHTTGNKLGFLAEFPRILRCEGTPLQAGDIALLNLPRLLLGLSQPALVLVSPYEFSLKKPMLLRSWIYPLLYPNGEPPNHHIATVLETPPLELRSNLGVQMLPGCAWFQVEFLMPEDPRNSLDYSDPTLDPIGPNGPQSDNWSERYDMPRWTEVVSGQTYVFVPDTQANREAVAGNPNRRAQFAWLLPPGAGGTNTVSNRQIRLWPYAIRVTVRVYDPRGRLEEPVVRSLVHRFE